MKIKSYDIHIVSVSKFNISLYEPNFSDSLLGGEKRDFLLSHASLPLTFYFLQDMFLPVLPGP